MDLSAASLWHWTVLYVRDPRLAAKRVKEANLPLEISLMFIVLAGIMWAVLSSALFLALGIEELIIPMSETEGMAFRPSGPILTGVSAVLTGVAFGYCVFKVGRMGGGQGSFVEILSITAVLEFIVAILIVAQYFVGLILPFAGLMVFFLAVFVLCRGLVHVMNEGHAFDDMGKSVSMVLGAFVMFVVVVMVMSVVFDMLGLSPDREIVPLPEEAQL